MENLDKIIAAGKSLGLEGDKLLQFVHEREEKEQKEKSDALARKERMKDREQKKLEKEAQIKLEMINKEIELQKARAETTPPPQPVPDAKAKIPKLPPFNEQRDNMDAYLKRFERFAESAGWDRSRWATNLSALLQGTALDVYSRLSGTEALDYDILRTSLLKRFQLTEEGFRLKFRRSTPEKGETASQFVTRIDSYLKRWMNLAKVEETYDGIHDLFLREQFMNSVQKNLQIFLKEHKIQSVKDMVELAEQYNEAHGIYGEPSYGKYQKAVTSNTQKNTSHLDNENPKVVNQRERYCYFCHSSDHFVKKCPNKRSSMSQPKTAGMLSSEFTKPRRGQSNYRNKSGSTKGQGSGQGSGNFNVRSYNKEDVGQIDKDETNVKTAASCVVQNIGALHQCCIVDCKVPLKCGHDLPLLSAACKNSG